MNLTDYDYKILRMLNGSDEEDLAWGAAMSVSIEFLHEQGLVYRTGNAYKISAEGRQILEQSP